MARTSGKWVLRDEVLSVTQIHPCSCPCRAVRDGQGCTRQFCDAESQTRHKAGLAVHVLSHSVLVLFPFSWTPFLSSALSWSFSGFCAHSSSFVAPVLHLQSIFIVGISAFVTFCYSLNPHQCSSRVPLSQSIFFSLFMFHLVDSVSGCWRWEAPLLHETCISSSVQSRKASGPAKALWPTSLMPVWG